MNKNEVFLDTSYIIALCSTTDHYHEKAKEFGKKLKAMNAKYITTRAIILEIGNALAKERYRNSAINLINSIETDSKIKIIPITEDLYYKAFYLYMSRMDKAWGLTDCISFTVMTDYNLSEALTADIHFQQAGFKALLL